MSDVTTWADISKDVGKIRNPNTKRSVIGALITMLGTKEGAPKQPRPQPKVYLVVPAVIGWNPNSADLLVGVRLDWTDD